MQGFMAGHFNLSLTTESNAFLIGCLFTVRDIDRRFLPRLVHGRGMVRVKISYLLVYSRFLLLPFHWNAMHLIHRSTRLCSRRPGNRTPSFIISAMSVPMSLLAGFELMVVLRNLGSRSRFLRCSRVRFRSSDDNDIFQKSGCLAENHERAHWHTLFSVAARDEEYSIVPG